jgi:arylsulfatase A-like enzyme
MLKRLFIVLVSMPLFIFSHAYAGQSGDESPNKYFPNLTRQAVGEQPINEPQTGQPIIWIVIDALRPQHLGAYGYPRETSPTMDQFADQGIIFTRFYANAPWTRPGTTSMFTGKIPTKHRVQCDWDKLPSDVGTVAQAMKKAGYTTLAVVGNGNVSSAFGLDKGFDVYEDTVKNWKGLPNARQVIDLGLKHLRKHKDKKKVFLLLFVLDPHDPYRPPKPYDDMFMPGYKGKIVDVPRWERNNNYPEPVRKKMLALYDGEIRYTDDQFAYLFDELKKLGFYDQASIFITSDHGESFGEHGIYLHGHHLYETHIRIPLMIRAPWLKDRGKYSSAFLQQIDLFPTFCQLAGTQCPYDLRGISIIEGLRNRSAIPTPRFVFADYNCYGIHRYAIRSRGYKLVYQQPADYKVFMKHVKNPKALPSVSFDKETFLLYHMLQDPHEDKDIWSQENNKDGKMLLKKLKAEISKKGKNEKAKSLDPELVEQLRSLGYMY